MRGRCRSSLFLARSLTLSHSLSLPLSHTRSLSLSLSLSSSLSLTRPLSGVMDKDADAREVSKLTPAAAERTWNVSDSHGTYKTVVEHVRQS